MQPNNTMGENTQANTATETSFASAGVTPEPPQTPQTPQTTPMSPSKDIVFRDKPKKNVGAIIGVIFLILLAAGGAGFGTWAYLSGNEKEANLNAKIDDLNAQLAAKPEVDETVVNVNTDSNTNTKEYIYVGEWGIKIKIPDNLEDISYEVKNWDEGNFAGTHLCVKGATTGHGSQEPSFVKYNFNESAFVCLGKNTKSISEEDGGSWNQTYPVGEYYINGPQAIAGDGTDQDWEVESVNALKNMLEDEANRSAI